MGVWGEPSPPRGFPCGSAGKESTCNAGDLDSIPGLGRSPGKEKGLLTPVFWPGEFHGLYSPWGRKELNTTEQLSLHFTPHLGLVPLWILICNPQPACRSDAADHIECSVGIRKRLTDAVFSIPMWVLLIIFNRKKFVPCLLFVVMW